MAERHHAEFVKELSLSPACSGGAFALRLAGGVMPAAGSTTAQREFWNDLLREQLSPGLQIHNPNLDTFLLVLGHVSYLVFGSRPER